MTRLRSLFCCALVSIVTFGCNERRAPERDTAPAPTDAPPSLTSAHEAYLAGAYVEMGESIKDVLVDPRAGELAKDNAYAVLESAYEATAGKLPARGTLPPSVSTMTFGVLNGATPYGPHRIVFLFTRLVEGRAAHIQDVRVTKLPGEPILGLAEKRGVLKVDRTMRGFEDVKLELRDVEVLPDRGAFSIQIVFDDAPAIDTFILANKLVASTQPEVTSPSVNEVFAEPRPEIMWRPFHSPDLAPWEERELNLTIVRDDTKQTAWGLYKWAPGELATMRVGEPGTPSATLLPGAYWFDMMCTEVRSFGGIWISRGASTARPFSVVR